MALGNCKNCMFWVERERDELLEKLLASYGGTPQRVRECRRRSPQVVFEANGLVGVGGVRAHWPITGPEGACGDFEEAVRA